MGPSMKSVKSVICHPGCSLVGLVTQGSLGRCELRDWSCQTTDFTDFTYRRLDTQ